MSGVESNAPATRATLRFGTIVVVGGGCYGSYYVRQLRRAAAANAVSWERLLVVDRDPACAVATATGTERATDLETVPMAWERFFADYLAAAATDPEASMHDAIVPSPLMPHLLYDWLLARARARWPSRHVAPGTIDGALPVPWQRDSPAGDTRYVSFAEWMCPVNCIEPARCPVTRGTRSWSLPPALQQYVERERADGRRLLGPHVFHCAHRAYGVGMIDVAPVIGADDAIARTAASGPAEILVGTASHCHGAVGIIAVGD